MPLDRLTGLINLIITIVFTACYAYQYIYILILVSVFGKPKPKAPPKAHRFAVLVAARNEETVIGELIASIRAQDYPAELIDMYVVADNCTDNTAKVAAGCGATVFERFDRTQVGKGYAMDYLLTKLGERAKTYDAFFVFDADNVLELDYITEMNKTFSDGYRIVTGYRNSKNFGDNWISSGYALWFLRESVLLNYPRHLIGSSCAVSGTGFMFAREVLEEQGGWKFFTLTEDLEFTARTILRGEKIGFCREAVLYDEQPVKFSQSWRQRLRWSCGALQILRRDGGKLLKGCFTPGIAFSCFDFSFNMFPAYILSLLALFANATLLILGLFAKQTALQLLSSFGSMLVAAYGAFFILGIVTTVIEWKRIHAKLFRKILAVFTFPLFAFTFVPIAVHALFVQKPKWKPIEHRRNLSLQDIHAK